MPTLDRKIMLAGMPTLDRKESWQGCQHWRKKMLAMMPTLVKGYWEDGKTEIVLLV
ncbi:MAG: hypothetical protein JST10_01300 [Bacteroidetes bacterium]|nr:hypothetical protein [Bacteroidota bacterium]MBS1631187.1 hypothetical protein [Bacteroidota bacterium]